MIFYSDYNNVDGVFVEVIIGVVVCFFILVFVVVIVVWFICFWRKFKSVCFKFCLFFRIVIIKVNIFYFIFV